MSDETMQAYEDELAQLVSKFRKLGLHMEDVISGLELQIYALRDEQRDSTIAPGPDPDLLG